MIKSASMFVGLLLLVSVVERVEGQALPASRNHIAGWHNAGLAGEPSVPDIIVNVRSFGAIGDGVANDLPAIQAAMNSLGAAGGVVYFPAGIYLIPDNAFDVNANTVLRGERSSNTEIKINGHTAGQLHAIRISGTTAGGWITVNSGYEKFSRTVQVADVSSFNAGDYAQIRMGVNSAWGMSSWANNAIGQIVRIESVNASAGTLTFVTPLRQQFYPNYTIDGVAVPVGIQKIIPKKNVGIENLKISRIVTSSGSANDNAFTVWFNYATECWVRGCEFVNFLGAAVACEYSANNEITGNYIQAPYEVDGGGSGYGVALQFRSSENLVENNIFRANRHSMLVQAGANGNVFGWNYAREQKRTEYPSSAAQDTIIHGNWAGANLFEGNCVANNTIDASSGHGINGPENFLFRNRYRQSGTGCGMYWTDSSIDQSFIGNEIVGTRSISKTGLFEYGDLKGTTKYPTAFTTLADVSYYWGTDVYNPPKPTWWNIANNPPTIGLPFTSNTSTEYDIPARARWNAGAPYTYAPPSISQQPVSATVNAGSGVSFTVVATGTPSVQYKWYKNGVEIAGAVSSSYTIASAQSADAAQYKALVSDARGSMYSATATLTVNGGTPTPPAAPSGLSASAASSSQINLSWADNANNETGFKIERSLTAGSGFAQIATVGANVTGYQDTGLAGGTIYYYRVRANNADGDSGYSNEANAATLATPPGGSGTISRQVWTGIAGNNVSDIPLSTTPAISDSLTSLEAPTDWLDSYGTRIRGYITAPASGSYTFWVASDDCSELWLSSSDQPANKVLIAYVNGWTPSRAWNTVASQKSAAITLTAGQKYYVEVLQKEGGGGDNLAVGWAKPGESTTAPSEIVPGTQLSPWTDAGTVLADGTAEFSSTQGQANWYYGYYDKPSASTFIQDSWNAGSGWWIGVEDWCLVASTFLHPGGGGDWTVRRWVAETSGTIHLAGTLAKTDVNGGDGIIGHLLVNGVEKWAQAIAYNDSVGVNYSLDVTVAAGDSVDFAVDPNGNYYNDSTKFTAIITVAGGSQPTVPAAPSGLAASSVSSSQINLGWTDNANDETGFKIERKTGSGGTFAQIATVGANVTSYQDTGLAAATAYYYRVRANNAAGDSGYSSEATATTASSGTALVAHWKLDETGGTTAIDSSGYGNSGTLVNGPMWGAGMVGGAVQLAGGSDYIFADNVAVNTVDGGCNTVAFWMKWNGTENQMPFGWNGLYDLWFYGGYFGINTAQSDIFGIASTGLAGQWVHVAVVFPNGVPSAANVKIYINGTLQTVAQRLSTSVGRSATSRVLISGWGNDGSYKFGGSIDDMRIYNRELSAAEVADLATVSGLPSPWAAQDIGSVGSVGSSSHAGGVYTIKGSGADIWGTADGFQYMYQIGSGDCDISVKVTAVGNTDPWAKAGVMIRDSLNANAMFADMVMTAGNGASFQYRTATGADCGYAQNAGLTAPYWVRLVRSGDSFTGYMSPDGTTWTQVGATQTITMGASTYIGLAVTAHNNSSLCTATLDNVTAVP